MAMFLLVYFDDRRFGRINLFFCCFNSRVLCPNGFWSWRSITDPHKRWTGKFHSSESDQYTQCILTYPAPCNDTSCLTCWMTPRQSHWIKVVAPQETSNQTLIRVTEKAHPNPNPDLLVLISICDLIRYSSLIVNTEVRRHPLSTESMCILKLTKAKYCLCLVILLVTF